MLPKQSRQNTRYPSKPRKRKFYGNQYSDRKKTCNAQTINKFTKASNEEIVVNAAYCYRIIEFFTVFGAISDLVVCKVCKENVKFGKSSNNGLGFKIAVSCQCGLREINSSPFSSHSYEINRRITFVMRLLGVTRDGINLFCALMDMGQGISKSTYEYLTDRIHGAADVIFRDLCKKAVQEEKQKNEENERPASCLKVSSDGSWKKRNSASLYGITSLVGHFSGKIIDLLVKESYCRDCKQWRSKVNGEDYAQWYDQHKEDCAANHSKSTGELEVEANKELFGRSEKFYQVKYGSYIVGENSKTYKTILDSNPYGDDLKVANDIKDQAQSARESFNATAWQLAPKHSDSNIKYIEIAAWIAASIFNEGYNSVLKIMNVLGIKIGQQCKFFVDSHDKHRTVDLHKFGQNSLLDNQIDSEQQPDEMIDFYEEDKELILKSEVET